MVNVAPGFTQTPAVIDGCSDTLVAIFGDAGRHTRSAVGLAELPFGIAVEIELIAEVDATRLTDQAVDPVGTKWAR